MTMLRSFVLLMVCASAASYILEKFGDQMISRARESFRPISLTYKTDSKWAQYKAVFRKRIRGVAVEKKRYAAFKESIITVEEHNLQFKLGISKFKLGLNEYSDLTEAEFKKNLLGLVVPKDPSCRGPSCQVDRKLLAATRRRVVRSLPETVDWRDHGLVTPVKNQGNCGACWAFATNGALEGQNAKHMGYLAVLSEQNLMDCSKGYGNKGCAGGWIYYAYHYVKANGGVDRPYYYEARTRLCRFDPGKVAGTCRSYRVVPRSEAALKEAVATIGPMAVAIDSRKASFRAYKDGVYNDPRCSKRWANHAVLVVGYGTYNGTKYWLIKNSWGTSWGLDGYMMLARDAYNTCGIRNYASYPLV